MGSDLKPDGTDRLCQALYGRPAQTRDHIGGSQARMLHDAADRLAAVESRIQSAVQQARQEEREACARLCETEADEWMRSDWAQTAYICAKAIRSRAPLPEPRRVVLTEDSAGMIAAVHDLWVDEIAGLVRGDMSKRVIVLVEEAPDAE